MGFGNGSLILTVQEFAFSVTGLDFRDAAIVGIKPYVLDARKVDFLEMRERACLTVISMAKE